jgi:hypothetical protein
MMMATGFDAPLTGAPLTGPSRRDSWDLRLKEGHKGRKLTGMAFATSAAHARRFTRASE